MDRICIDELKVFAHHGVFEHENINGQNFYINAVIYVDTECAGMTDELEYSVDYGSVCSLISDVMTRNTFRLIETAAQSIAEAVLTSFSPVQSIEVEVRKPEAPIEAEFGSVSVKIHRGWHTAVIAVGSNMGDSRSIIGAAVEELRRSRYIKELRQSELIVTKPYGYTEQADFLNGAVVCRTMYSPHGLLGFMQSIENKAGRTREIHWGPRTLDLDLIFYDDEIINDEKLVVPHPDMENRAFVLRPVAEIAPFYRHPVLGASVSQLLKRLEQK